MSTSDHGNGTGRFLDSITVGFDGQPRSEGAVSAALALARALESRVEVVHVSDIRETKPDRSEAGALAKLWEERAREIRERAAERLTELETEAGFEGVDPGSLLSLQTGHPAHVLAEHVHREEPDLFVFGPHERHGRFDFGSTARAVMGHGRCDLWYQPGAWGPIERILVPVDLSPQGAHALHSATRLAQAFGARLTAMHSYVPPSFCYSSEAIEVGAATDIELIRADREVDREAFDAQLAEAHREFLDASGVEFSSRWEEGEADEVILSLAKDFDLITMGTHGRTGIGAALFGNVAYSVLKRSEIPVFAVRLPSGK